MDSGAVTVLRECLLENNHNMRKYAAAAIAAIAASYVSFVKSLLYPLFCCYALAIEWCLYVCLVTNGFVWRTTLYACVCDTLFMRHVIGSKAS